MDSVVCLKHLTPDYELGCGFFLFASFKQIFKVLVTCLLCGLGLKFLNSHWFFNTLFHYLCKNVILSGNAKGGLLKFLEYEAKNAPLMNSTKEISDTDINEELNDDEDDEYDVSILRKMIKHERQRAATAIADLEKERLASSSAAEEAMAMILKLQNEMSLIEIESNQFKRLAEEKQIHDQQVIQSLQWLVLRHESEKDLLDHKLRFYQRRSKRYETEFHECGDRTEEDDEEAESSFNGDIMEALENVLYSSRDAGKFEI